MGNKIDIDNLRVDVLEALGKLTSPDDVNLTTDELIASDDEKKKVKELKAIGVKARDSLDLLVVCLKDQRFDKEATKREKDALEKKLKEANEFMQMLTQENAQVREENDLLKQQNGK